MTHINLICSDSFEMIQNNFKGKIHLQYRNQVMRLHGNSPSLCPAVMERYVEQRVLTNCREVKASGAVREHLRYIRMTPCSPLGPVSGTCSQNQAAQETNRRTHKSMHSHRVRDHRDMVGLHTTRVLQCMDTNRSGQTGWEGRLSTKRCISCQQALQTCKCVSTISFYISCKSALVLLVATVISRALGTDITIKSVRILLMKTKQVEKMTRLWVFTFLLYISKVQISKCVLICSRSSC